MLNVDILLRVKRQGKEKTVALLTTVVVAQHPDTWGATSDAPDRSLQLVAETCLPLAQALEAYYLKNLDYPETFSAGRDLPPPPNFLWRNGAAWGEWSYQRPQPGTCSISCPVGDKGSICGTRTGGPWTWRFVANPGGGGSDRPLAITLPP